MLFDTSFRPEFCTSDDPDRKNLRTVELSREADNKSYLVATDGHTLACVPVSDADGDATGPIPPEALETARKIAKKRKSSVGEIRCGLDVLTFADGSTMPRPKREPNASFPDYRRVLPAFDPAPVLNDPREEAVRLTFGLNPELLIQVAKSIGVKGVIALQIEVGIDGHVTAPIIVRHPHDGKVSAVVMPGRVEATNERKLHGT